MSALGRLQRALAETLVRSGLDTSDDILILSAFLHDFRWSDRRASAAELAEDWRDLLAKPPPGHFLNLYLHFPFCAEKCLFCLYASRVPPGARTIGAYVEQAQAEIEHHARVFDGAKFRTFAAGGGTPSLLSAGDLERFYAPVFAGFRFEDDAFISIECSPSTVDAEKLRVLRGLGFSRISFGVQSLDAKVLRSVRRGSQRTEMVEAAVRGARGAGFEDVNLDLLFGLLGDGTESFLESFRGVARLRPTTIQVCGLSLTDGYVRANRISRPDFYRRYAALLPAALEGMRREASAAGYVPDGLGPEKGVWAFVAQETPRATFKRWMRKEPHGRSPCSFIGLGEGGRSHVFGRAHHLRCSGAFDPAAGLYCRAPLTTKEEMALYLFYSFETSGRVRLNRFREHFGVELRDAMALEVDILLALGALRSAPGGFRFTPAAQTSRIFHGLVLILDAAGASPHSSGRIDAELLRGVRRELEGVHA